MLGRVPGWFSHVVLFSVILPLGAFCILRVHIVALFPKAFNIFSYFTYQKNKVGFSYYYRGFFCIFTSINSYFFVSDKK